MSGYDAAGLPGPKGENGLVLVSSVADRQGDVLLTVADIAGAAAAADVAANLNAAIAQEVTDRNAAIEARTLRGTLAARPAPGAAGRRYLATDTVQEFLSDGAAWIEVVTRAVADATFSSKAETAAVYARRAEDDVLLGLVPRPRANPSAPRGLFRAEGSGPPPIDTVGAGYTVGDLVTAVGGVNNGFPAVFRVATVNGAGGITTVTVDRPGVYTARPPAPFEVSGGTGAGAKLVATWSSNLTSTMLSTAQLIGPTDARYRVSGNALANINASGYFGPAVAGGSHSTIEWDSDATQIDVRLLGFNTGFVLYVDDQQVTGAAATTDASGAGTIYAVDFGGAARWRRYKLVAVNMAFGGVRIPAGATLTAPRAILPAQALVLGDSYTQGSGAENRSTTWAHVMCEQLGVEPICDGVGGAGWATADDRLNAKLPAMVRPPAQVFLALGFNDAGADPAVTAAHIDAAVAAIRTALGNAIPIHLLGPWTPVGTTAALDTMRQTISDRAAALGCSFVDIRNFVDAANKARFTGADNTHPTALGHRYLGARLAIAARTLIPI